MTAFLDILSIVFVLGISSPEVSHAGDPVPAATRLYETEFELAIPEKSQSVVAHALLMIQQRVRASGSFWRPAGFQVLLPEGEGRYRLIVRGSALPRLLETAVGLPQLFGFVPLMALDNTSGRKVPLLIHSRLLELPTWNGSRARTGPFASLNDRQIHRATLSLSREGRRCIVIRLDPSAAFDQLRTRRQLGREPVGLVTAGLVQPLPGLLLEAPLSELELPAGDDGSRAAAVCGLLDGAREPLPTEVTVVTVLARGLPPGESTPDGDALRQEAPPPGDEAGYRDALRSAPPLRKLALLEHRIAAGGELSPAVMLDLLGQPDPGLAAAPLRVSGSRTGSDLLLRLLGDPRVLVRDAALERLLEGGSPPLLRKALETLARSDALAWSAAPLARGGVREAVPFLEAYLRRPDRPYPYRQGTLAALIHLDPESEVVKALFKDTTDPLWALGVLILDERTTGRVSDETLLKLVQTGYLLPDERLEAAHRLFSRNRSRGTWAFKWLSRQSDAMLRSRARRDLEELQKSPRTGP